MSAEIKDIKDRETWYDLKLGESVRTVKTEYLNQYLIRVPSGWILENQISYENEYKISNVFIPFAF